MNKRGQTKFIINALLILAGFVVIVSMIGMFMRGCEKNYELRACHDSLISESKVFEKVGEMIPSADTKKPWPPTCKTSGPVVIDDKNSDVIMRKIADMMVQCWWALGESGRGGFDPFAQNTWWIGKPKCFSCYSVKIENVDINKDDFQLWLITHNIEDDPDKPTYWNYLLGTLTEEQSAWYKSHFKGVAGDISKGNYYAIAYMDFEATKLQEFLGTTPSENEQEYVEDLIFITDWNKASKAGCRTE